MAKGYVRIKLVGGNEALIKVSTIQLVQPHPTNKGEIVISTTNKKYSMFRTKQTINEIEDLLG